MVILNEFNAFQNIQSRYKNYRTDKLVRDLRQREIERKFGRKPKNVSIIRNTINGALAGAAAGTVTGVAAGLGMPVVQAGSALTGAVGGFTKGAVHKGINYIRRKNWDRQVRGYRAYKGWNCRNEDLPKNVVDKINGKVGNNNGNNPRGTV